MNRDRIDRLRAAIKINLVQLAGEWGDADGSYGELLDGICAELEEDLEAELRRRRHLRIVPGASGDAPLV